MWTKRNKILSSRRAKEIIKAFIPGREISPSGQNEFAEIVDEWIKQFAKHLSSHMTEEKNLKKRIYDDHVKQAWTSFIIKGWKDEN